MIEKRCPKCQQFKPPTSFGRDKARKDGLKVHCKECRKAEMRAYHQTEAGKETLKKAHQKFLTTEKGKAYNRAGTKRWLRSDKGKAYQAEKQREYRRINRLQMQARGAVNDAVRYGKLPAVNTQQCTKCPNRAEHYHHRNGYEREHWLDIIPLCIQCHTEAG